MVEENKEQNKDQETVPKADLDALRSKLDKQAADARKRADDAEGRVSQLEQRLVGNQYDVKLPEGDDTTLDDTTREAIKNALSKAEETQRNLGTAVQYALDKTALALSWEVAVEVKAVDDRTEIYEKLKSVSTPKEMEILAKEIRLEYKERASTSKSEDSNKADDADSERKFAGSGGKGAPSKSSTFQKQIDDIDVTDPESQKKMDAIYKEMFP